MSQLGELKASSWKTVTAEFLPASRARKLSESVGGRIGKCQDEKLSKLLRKLNNELTILITLVTIQLRHRLR